MRGAGIRAPSGRRGDVAGGMTLYGGTGGPAPAMKENDVAADWEEVYRLILARRGPE